MIQRVQTLFLAAIIGLSTLLFFKPFQIVKDDGVSTFFVTLMPGALPGIAEPIIYLPIVLNFIIIAFSIHAILNFKDRRKQIKICQVILALSAILIGTLFTLTFLNLKSSELIVDYTVYSFIPAINIIFAFLARFFIKKDDKLVRSADRIR